MKIFWSWQADTPGGIGRHFIRGVLEEVIKDLRERPEIDDRGNQRDYSELHLDHDRKGASGSPELARLILSKIDSSIVFVADVTTTGIVPESSSDPHHKKPMNSNVAIELGYALKSIGDASILMVMNEHYGSRSDLPFDLHTKAGPILFRLSPKATAAEIKDQASKLKGVLKRALSEYLNNHSINVAKSTAFPAVEPRDGESVFRSKDEPIGMRWSLSPLDRRQEDVFIAPGAAIWLRLMPLHNIGKQWTVTELLDVARSPSLKLAPLAKGFDFYVRADDGIGSCISVDHQEATSFAFLFKTGEIWSRDASLFRFYQVLDIGYIETLLTEAARNYAEVLARLKIHHPYKWIAGVSGVRGYRVELPIPQGHFRIDEGPLCASNLIVATGTYTESPKTDEEVFEPFLQRICEEGGLNYRKS